MKIAIMYDKMGWIVDKMNNTIIKYAPKDVKFIKFRHDITFEELLKLDKKADVIYSAYWQPFVKDKYVELEGFPKDKVLFTVHHLMRLGAKDWDPITPQLIHKNVKHINYYSRNTQEDLCLMGYKGSMYKLNQYVDSERFKDICPKELGENLVVGNFGQLNRPRKGLDTLGDTLRSMMKVEVVITKGPQIKHVPTKQKGLVSDNLMPQLFKELNVYVSTSLVEGGPVGVLEAMACGIPVVVTNTGFAGDIVKHGINGFLIPFNSPEALKSRLEWIRNNYQEALVIGENGRRTVLKYSPQKFSEQYIKLFREIGR